MINDINCFCSEGDRCDGTDPHRTGRQQQPAPHRTRVRKCVGQGEHKLYPNHADDRQKVFFLIPVFEGHFEGTKTFLTPKLSRAQRGTF